MNEREFRKLYFQICKKGYSCLGQTLANLPTSEQNEWQFKAGYPPSYPAQGRFRFLETLETAKNLKPRRILEIGTGDGFNGACLYEPGREILLNDLRPVQGCFSQWKNGKNLNFIQKNFFDLNSSEIGHFDLVMACEVIEHVADGPKFISHLKSLLAPGGTLLVTTPNGKYFRSKLPTFSQIKDFKEFEARQFGPDSDDHLYLYTPNELQKLLQDSGFNQIKINLSITPWISGHCGFRFLPSGHLLTQLYYFLDKISCLLGKTLKETFCSQMIVSATTKN